MRRAIIFGLLVALPFSTVLGQDQKNQRNDAPGLKAQGEKFKFDLQEYRDGKNRDHTKALALLNSLISIYDTVGDTETVKGYSVELARLRAGHPELGPTQAVRTMMQSRINEYEVKLRAYKAGKRSHKDAYLLLQGLQGYYVVVRQKDKAREANRELEKIKKEHPDLVTNPPTEFEEARRNREDKERRTKELTSKPFIPKDNDPLDVIESSDNVVMVYQYRIEFFKLTNGAKFKTEVYQAIPGVSDPKAIRKFLRDGKDYTPIPHRVITFSWPFARRPLYPGPTRIMAVCTNPLAAYNPRDEEEEAIVSALSHGSSPRHYYWKNPKAEFENFCGVISLDGQIVFQLPYEPIPPSFLMRPFEILENEGEALWGVGEAIPSDEGGPPWIGNIRELVLWKHPDTVRRYDVSGLNAEGEALRKKYGVTEEILKRK